ncbi:hypothetical protein PanWU01x14_203090 [Parasponia andersonii]|uniref:Uncharacterized protein n=1 Tax=Parasponia andersonii TaxID=3476 RepID=A0A2P5BWY9_PARAD|nr:hypothetical protein PanWU01x14_203090 [Parasponia andersonii]
MTQQQPQPPPPPPPPPPPSNDNVFTYLTTSLGKWQRDQSDVVVRGGTRACTDCGNRAKRDCGFSRCRTCCKARAFPCSTHVRSTWVPPSRRRLRLPATLDGAGGNGSSGSSSASKRPRLHECQTDASHSHTSNSNNAITTPKGFHATSIHQDAIFKQSLPNKVRAPAIFRCHRVTAIGDGKVEIAYQVTVRISGHVFKGFLYDQGVVENNGDYSSTPIVFLSTPNPTSTS